MRNAVFKLALRRGHFKVATVLKLSVDDVVDRISTPIEGIKRAAAGATTATPFIREQNLGAVIVECR